MNQAELNNKILECRYCPFMEYAFNDTKRLGFGNQYRILFVGLSPALASNKSADFSKFDAFFNRLLGDVKIYEQDYYFTHLCKTSIPKDVKLTDEQIKHCLSHISQEINFVRPQVIVLLGQSVYNAFGISYAGKVYDLKLANARYKVYPIQHPGILYYKPESQEQYLTQLNKIHRYYKPILI